MSIGSRVLLSVLAGVATPFLSMLALAAAGRFGGLLESKTSWAVFLSVDVLICATPASWKFVLPWVYGVSVFVAFCVTGNILVARHPGNLAAIVLFMFVVFGLFVAAASTALGQILQWLSLPVWTPLILLGLGVALGAGALVSSQLRHTRDAQDIVTQLSEIRAAEMQYAAARADRAFTCNGPDLPGGGKYDWRANTALGTVTKDEARIDGYWVYLQCEASSTPHFFSLRAVSPPGRELYLDSRGQTRRSPSAR